MPQIPEGLLQVLCDGADAMARAAPTSRLFVMLPDTVEVRVRPDADADKAALREALRGYNDGNDDDDDITTITIEIELDTHRNDSDSDSDTVAAIRTSYAAMCAAATTALGAQLSRYCSPSRRTIRRINVIPAVRPASAKKWAHLPGGRGTCFEEVRLYDGRRQWVRMSLLYGQA
jgi:hypothetical protein